MAALGDGPLALFLDVDGTLLDLAERPGDVVTPAGLFATLAKPTQARGGAPLISGRPMEQLDRLFEPLRFRASGVHGAEMRFIRSPSPAPRRRRCPIRAVAALHERFQFPGVFAETNTSVSPSITGCAARRPLREAVMRLVEAAADPVEVLDAHCAIEVKAPGPRQGRRD